MSESTATTSREETRERWRGLVSEQRGSGESMRGFCRGRGISYPRFLAWTKRFAGNGDGARFEGFGVAAGRGASDAFCELRVGASAAFEVVVGGVVVRAPSGFDAAELGRLLRLVVEMTSPVSEVVRPLRGTPRSAGEARRPC